MKDFTQDTQKALRLAETYASQSGSLIESVHILAALTHTENSFGAEILRRLGFTEAIAESYLLTVQADGFSTALSSVGAQILEFAQSFAKSAGYTAVDTQHVLLALCYHKTTTGAKILNKHGIDYNTVLSIVNGMSYSGIGKAPAKSAPVQREVKKAETKKEVGLEAILAENGFDLTKKAREGKLDAVIGRDKEIARVIQILSRRTKNNPVIIGEPGVGKTAIAEGLAQRIAAGNVPDFLKDRTIYSLNVNNLISGTRYRGELEEKIKNILSALENKNFILFIDELHSVMTAGGSEGGLNIGNVLKPALVSGKFFTIGATTISEYRKFIEKDSAFERRFMPVTVPETSIKETVNILNGLKPSLEKHHKITISDEALNASVTLSARFLTDRFLPDKAIDVLDEACSKKMSAQKKSAKPRLTKADIEDLITEMTGVPVKQVSSGEAEKLLKMEEILSQSVIGQDKAITAISKAVRRARAGLKAQGRPVGSFIFLGPTGVGKTETAKALCRYLFGSESAMIRLDMSEYMEKISASKLIGSPPGYVGYDEGGYLTEAVRRKPYSVILLDEIEKAHLEVFNVLLQVLDDGRLTDNKGRTVDFRNTIIIMTSNIGSELLSKKKKVGFNSADTIEDDKEIQLKALKDTLRPEFLNRIDNIVVFNGLDKENIKKIAYLLLNDLSKTLFYERKIKLTFDNEAVDFLTENSFDPAYGARPMKRAIEALLEDKLSEIIIGKDLRNTRLNVSLDCGKIDIKNQGE